MRRNAYARVNFIRLRLPRAVAAEPSRNRCTHYPLGVYKKLLKIEHLMSHNRRLLEASNLLQHPTSLDRQVTQGYFQICNRLVQFSVPLGCFSQLFAQNFQEMMSTCYVLNCFIARCLGLLLGRGFRAHSPPPPSTYQLSSARTGGHAAW